jgi:hypothetical protein
MPYKTTLSIIRAMPEMVHTYETSVYFNKTIWCNLPKGCNLHTCHCENLKSHSPCPSSQSWMMKLEVNSCLLCKATKQFTKALGKYCSMSKVTVFHAGLFLENNLLIFSCKVIPLPSRDHLISSLCSVSPWLQQVLKWGCHRSGGFFINSFVS